MQLLHSTSARTADIPVTETVFVVIENHDSDPAGSSGYQIQMWQLTVFHTTVVDSIESQISRKQI